MGEEIDSEGLSDFPKVTQLVSQLEFEANEIEVQPGLSVLSQSCNPLVP